jgi:hypothetical protein
MCASHLGTRSASSARRSRSVIPTTSRSPTGRAVSRPGAHGRARGALDEGVALGDLGGDRLLARGVLGGAERLHHDAGVDVDRARPLAHAVTGARLDGEVGVVALQAASTGDGASPGTCWRTISRRSTIRWRGVVVSSRLGQTGSQ